LPLEDRGLEGSNLRSTVGLAILTRECSPNANLVVGSRPLPRAVRMIHCLAGRISHIEFDCQESPRSVPWTRKTGNLGLAGGKTGLSSIWTLAWKRSGVRCPSGPPAPYVKACLGVSSSTGTSSAPKMSSSPHGHRAGPTVRFAHPRSPAPSRPLPPCTGARRPHLRRRPAPDAGAAGHSIQKGEP
jgi:hypothetical protein